MSPLSDIILKAQEPADTRLLRAKPSAVSHFIIRLTNSDVLFSKNRESLPPLPEVSGNKNAAYLHVSRTLFPHILPDSVMETAIQRAT